jgi:redox-regulated HSP33 family molecular chaperone
MFSVADLESIQQDGGTDLNCHFCAETYTVSADDICELITIKEQEQ